MVLFNIRLCQADTIGSSTHLHPAVFFDFSADYPARQRCFHFLLDQALQRPGTVGGVVALFCQIAQGLVIPLQISAQILLETLRQLLQQQVGDLLDLLRVQGLEEKAFGPGKPARYNRGAQQRTNKVRSNDDYIFIGAKEDGGLISLGYLEDFGGCDRIV